MSGLGYFAPATGGAEINDQTVTQATVWSSDKTRSEILVATANIPSLKVGSIDGVGVNDAGPIDVDLIAQGGTTITPDDNLNRITISSPAINDGSTTTTDLLSASQVDSRIAASSGAVNTALTNHVAENTQTADPHNLATQIDTATLNVGTATVTGLSTLGATTVDSSGAITTPVGVTNNLGNVQVNSLTVDNFVTLDTVGGAIEAEANKNINLTVTGANQVVALQNQGTTQLQATSTGVEVDSITGIAANQVTIADTTYAPDLIGGVAVPSKLGISDVSPAVANTLWSAQQTESQLAAVAAGIKVKQSVRCVTLDALPAFTYDASVAPATITASANGPIADQDGVNIGAGDRILVANQTDAKHNGIYDLTQAGNGGSPFILTRSSDSDGAPVGEVSAGDVVYVREGTTHAGDAYVLTHPGTADGNHVIGTPLSQHSEIVWSLFPSTIGSGSVVSVNSIGPDGAGNVTLSAANVGALATTGGTLTGNLRVDKVNPNITINAAAGSLSSELLIGSNLGVAGSQSYRRDCVTRINNGCVTGSVPGDCIMQIVDEVNPTGPSFWIGCGLADAQVKVTTDYVQSRAEHRIKKTAGNATPANRIPSHLKLTIEDNPTVCSGLGIATDQNLIIHSEGPCRVYDKDHEVMAVSEAGIEMSTRTGAANPNISFSCGDNELAPIQLRGCTQIRVEDNYSGNIPTPSTGLVSIGVSSTGLFYWKDSSGVTRGIAGNVI